MSQSRQLAAIMFTDIVGYTATMQNDENLAIGLVKSNIAIQKPIIQNNNGQLLKEMGDGTMSSFQSALEAVKCAIQIQQAVAINLKGKIRIGIHVGDITIQQDEIYGDGVNLASRIESITDPGGIYVSENVVNSIQGQKDFQTVYVGEKELKNIAEPQKIFAIQGFGLPVPEIPRLGFWHEIVRRDVPQAGLIYILLSIFLYIGFKNLGFEDHVDTLLRILIVGFPVALVTAWFFERGPSGFIRTTSTESILNPYSKVSKKPFTGYAVMFLISIGILVVTLLPGGLKKSENQIKENTLAVLYFDNMSGDVEQEYFSDGITEEIIFHLAKIEGLEVRSRTSVIRYKSQKQEKSITEIAKELRVATVLEGSIRKSGNQVRITAQLINGATDKHLWSKDYNFEFEDIFKTQYAVAKAISEQFQLQISPKLETDIITPPTISMKAFDLYLQAAKIWNKGVGIGNRSQYQQIAKTQLRKAIELDPEYVEAYALLSKVYSFSYHQNASQHILDSAEILGNTAVALDPGNEVGYLALGFYYRLIDQHEVAEKWLQKGIQLNPKEGTLALADLYAKTNRIPESLELCYKYLNLYPADYEGWRGALATYIWLGMSDSVETVRNRVSEKGFPEFEELFGVDYHLGLKQLDKAEELLRKDFSEDTLQFNRGLARIYMMKKEWMKALTCYLNSSYDGMDKGLVYFKLGMKDSAEVVFERHLARIKELEPNLNVYAYFDLGRIYLYHGDKKLGIELIQKAFDMGWHGPSWLHTDPFFTELIGDPDVDELVEKADRKNQRIMEEIRKLDF